MADATAAAARPGYQTTEFWVTLAASVAPYLVNALPPQYAALASAVLAGFYTIGRSMVKATAKPGELPAAPAA